MAVVTSTGYMTAKGSLVSAIMYPPPVDFRFERDSYRFIGFLSCLASLGVGYNIISRVNASQFLFEFIIQSIVVKLTLNSKLNVSIIELSNLL